MNDIDDEDGEMDSQTLYTPLFSGPAALDTGGLLNLLDDPLFMDKVDKAEAEDRQLAKARPIQMHHGGCLRHTRRLQLGLTQPIVTTGQLNALDQQGALAPLQQLGLQLIHWLLGQNWSQMRPASRNQG